jgi:hypothetical protein
MSYYQKYLKYKSKYLELKGGLPKIGGLYYLGKDPMSSLKPVQKLIEESGVDKTKVAVFFDFDGTLTTNQNPTALRGSAETKSLFDWFNKNKIHWFVNSAKEGAAFSIFDRSKLPFIGLPYPTPLFNVTKECKTKEDQEEIIHKDIKIYQCNNIFTSDFNKKEVIEYVVTKLKEKGEDISLIILVDDSADNIYNVYQYFKNENDLHFTKDNFIGVIAEPLIEEEPHIAGRDQYEKGGLKSLIEESIADTWPIKDLMTGENLTLDHLEFAKKKLCKKLINDLIRPKNTDAVLKTTLQEELAKLDQNKLIKEILAETPTIAEQLRISKWKKSFKDDLLDIKIYFLERHLSLSPITKLINESGFKSDDIVVMFDYDQTLTAKEGSGMAAPLVVRGKDKTLKMIDDLNKQKIKWYINTAAGTGTSALGSIAGQMKKLLKIPFSNFKIYPEQPDCYKEKSYSFFGTEIKDDKGTTIGVCNNIISAGYNKEIATDFILKNLPSKPKLVIFVDDSASNIMNLYIYFKKRNDINYIGIIYDPLITAEKDHLEAIIQFEKNNVKIIQITEEYTQ